MRAFGAFFAKEVIESLRTYKAFALVVVFLIFGFMNPLAAKFTPELISALAGDELALAFPEPSAIDSWMQFFKNASQMGLIVMIILFSSILSKELSRGTLINLLTKGLSRTTVVLAKFLLLVCVWTVAYILCALVTLGYTIYLFPDGSVENLLFSLAALWLFGILLLAALICAGSMLNSNYACLLAVGACFVVLMLVSIIPAAAEFNPLSLASANLAFLAGTANPEDYLPAVIITGVATIAFVVLSVVMFRKRAL